MSTMWWFLRLGLSQIIMFSFTPCSGHSLRGFCRWFGTGHGFLATGIASGSVSSLTSISLPVLLSQKHPMPWNLSLYSLSNASMSSGGFTDLILSSSVHVSLSVPSGLILIIASSISAFLLKSGGESIFPSITEHLLFAPWFLFRIVVWNSPLTTPVYNYHISLESLQCFFAWIYIVVLWFPLICVLGLQIGTRPLCSHMLCCQVPHAHQCLLFW